LDSKIWAKLKSGLRTLKEFQKKKGVKKFIGRDIEVSVKVTWIGKNLSNNKHIKK
jgi:hypothetical protein